jgi:hypothetical protein
VHETYPLSLSLSLSLFRRLNVASNHISTLHELSYVCEAEHLAELDTTGNPLDRVSEEELHGIQA